MTHDEHWSHWELVRNFELQHLERWRCIWVAGCKQERMTAQQNQTNCTLKKKLPLSLHAQWNFLRFQSREPSPYLCLMCIGVPKHRSCPMTWIAILLLNAPASSIECVVRTTVLRAVPNRWVAKPTASSYFELRYIWLLSAQNLPHVSSHFTSFLPCIAMKKNSNYPGKRPQTVYYRGFMCR